MVTVTAPVTMTMLWIHIDSGPFANYRYAYPISVAASREQPAVLSSRTHTGGSAWFLVIRSLV